MKKLYRSAMFAGVLAIGVAACGDDVTVTEAPPPPPPPLQVTMSPSNQAIQVGETAVFAVGISGGEAGAQASHTCASSATAVASVSTVATGCQVTGVSAGAASITVTVTKGSQSAAAGGQVTVSAPPAPEPEPVVTRASVSIASITAQGAVPTFNNIAGQIEVNLNVRPNDESVRRVIVFIDGVEAASQVLAGNAFGAEAAETPEMIQLPINTAAYTIDATAGTSNVLWANGNRVVSAAIEVADREDATTAAEEFNIRLNNQDGFHILATPPANNALDNAGRIWYGGPGTSTVITAIPVMYTGREIASVSIDFCGAGTAITAAPFTATRACANTETSTDGITPNPSSVLVGTGAGPAGVGSILNDDHPFPIRIDTRAPQGGSLVIAQMSGVGNRANWVRADYAFSTGYTAPTDGGVSAGATITRTFNARAGTTVIAEDVTTAGVLDNSVTNAAYNVVAVVSDRLGNTRTITQSAGSAPNNAATFGVDKGAPILVFGANNDFPSDTTTIQYFGNLPNTSNLHIVATDSLSGFALASDSGLRGLEHVFVRILGTPGSSVLDREALVGTGTVSATPFATRAAGNFIAGAVQVDDYEHDTTLIFIDDNPDLFDDIAIPGYFIYQVRARDRAGNLSPILTRAFYLNEFEDPEITGLVTTAGPYVGGSVVEFPAAAQDAVEVVDGSFDVRYPDPFDAGFDIRLTYDRAPVQQDGVKFNDVITNPSQVTFSTAGGFIRSLTGVDTDGIPVGSISKPNQVNGRVYNGHPGAGINHLTEFDSSFSEGFSDYFSAPLLGTQVATAPANTWSARGFGDPVDGDNGWTISAVATTSGATRTVTLTAQARGVSNSFANPFAAVAIVRSDTPVDLDGDAICGTGESFVRILGFATATPGGGFPALDDGVRRDWRWTFTTTQPATAYRTYHAVGINAAFDGLVTEGVSPLGTDPCSIP